MLKPLLATAVVTAARGTGAGSSTVHGTLHPVGLAGSAQVAALDPSTLIGGAVPPKLTPPLVAATKSLTAVLPSVSSVGKAKFQYLKPVIGLPLPSLPLALLAAM